VFLFILNLPSIKYLKVNFKNIKKAVWKQYEDQDGRFDNSGGVFFFFSHFILWRACSTFSIEFFYNFLGFYGWENHGFSPDVGSLDLDGAGVIVENWSLFFGHHWTIEYFDLFL
jgi:hypothetical protein